MSSRQLTLLLHDILEAAQDAIGFVEGLDAATFERLPDEDHKTYRALKNAVTEIGEAIKGLPQDLSDRHPDVDWRGLAGLRDVVAHQYHRIDMQRLWPVLVEEFPVLVTAVRAELDDRLPPPAGSES